MGLAISKVKANLEHENDRKKAEANAMLDVLFQEATTALDNKFSRLLNDTESDRNLPILTRLATARRYTLNVNAGSEKFAQGLTDAVNEIVSGDYASAILATLKLGLNSFLGSTSAGVSIVEQYYIGVENDTVVRFDLYLHRYNLDASAMISNYCENMCCYLVVKSAVDVVKAEPEAVIAALSGSVPSEKLSAYLDTYTECRSKAKSFLQGNSQLAPTSAALVTHEPAEKRSSDPPLCGTFTAPPDEQSGSKQALKAFFQRSTQWDQGHSITIKFLNGSDEEKKTFTHCLDLWFKTSSGEWRMNLKYKFVTSGESDVRVRFNEENISQSQLGTAARDISQSQATFDLRPGATQWEYVHEMGHMLGLVHEHQAMEAGGSAYRLDEQKTYEYWHSQNHAYSYDLIKHNVTQGYAAAELNGDKYDANSVMNYSMPNSCFKDGKGPSISFGDTPSEMDLETTGKIYSPNPSAALMAFQPATVLRKLKQDGAKPLTSGLDGGLDAGNALWDAVGKTQASSGFEDGSFSGLFPIGAGGGWKPGANGFNLNLTSTTHKILDGSPINRMVRCT